MSSRRFVAPAGIGSGATHADTSISPDTPISLDDIIDTETTNASGSADPSIPPTVQRPILPDTAPLSPVGHDPDQAYYLKQLRKHGRNLRRKNHIPSTPTSSLPQIQPTPSDHLHEKTRASPTDSKPVVDGSKQDDVDWFGYWLAIIQYRMSGPNIQSSPPHEPFTIQRLRSNGERLYIAARPAWETFGVMLGDVIMWEDWKRTVRWILVYAILVITSRFVIFFHLVLLYHLVRGRFPAPTTSSDPHLEDDAEALVDAVMPPAILTDEDAAAGLASMAMDELNGRKDKQPKEKRRWRKKWERFQTEHGMGAVVVLGDLADMHEKAANLFTWKDPSSSFWFTLALLGSAAVTLRIPTLVLLKLFQIGFGFLVFLVIPAAARQVQYDPLSWLFGSAPTNAEYAVRILRQRMAAGEPLLIPVTTEADETVSTRSIPTGISAIPDPSNPPADVVPPKGLSDWARMKDLAIKTRDNSHKWLEVGRSIRSGETEVRLSGLLGTIRGEEVEDPSVRHLRLKSGPGISLRSRSNTETGHTSFMAQHDGRLGTLFITASWIRFAPIQTSTSTKDVKPESSTGTDIDTISSITPASDIKIAMEDIISINKIDRTAVKLKVTSGLSFQKKDGSDLILPFVAHRNDAFFLFLALSQSAFSAV